jgi:hypothetical protein
MVNYFEFIGRDGETFDDREIIGQHLREPGVTHSFDALGERKYSSNPPTTKIAPIIFPSPTVMLPGSKRTP